MHELYVPDGRLNTLFQPYDLIVDVLVAILLLRTTYIQYTHTCIHHREILLYLTEFRLYLICTD